MSQNKKGLRGTLSIVSNIHRTPTAHPPLSRLSLKKTGNVTLPTKSVIPAVRTAKAPPENQSFNKGDAEMLERPRNELSSTRTLPTELAIPAVRTNVSPPEKQSFNKGDAEILERRRNELSSTRVSRSVTGRHILTSPNIANVSPVNPTRSCYNTVRSYDLKKEWDRLREIDLPLISENRTPPRRAKETATKILLWVALSSLMLGLVVLGVLSVMSEWSNDEESQDEGWVRVLQRVERAVPSFSSSHGRLLPSLPAPPLACPNMRRASAYFDLRWRTTWPQQSLFEPLWILPLERNVHISRKMEADVFIIPFSLVGPVSDEPYEVTLKRAFRILDNMVDKLSQYRTMTFMWNEVGLLAKWWERADDWQKDSIMVFLKQGRLEITNGGWVMPEEGVTDIFGLYHQQLEGQLWLERVLKMRPQSAWLGGVYGHTPVLSYLHRLSGVTAGTILDKIPFTWMKTLFLDHMSTFTWRQDWDLFNTFDNFVYAHPFKSFTMEEGCGPNYNVCQTLNFYKGFKERNIATHEFTFSEILEVAHTLGEQLWKTAEGKQFAYVVLPLGGRFSYEDPEEWDVQFGTMNKIMESINIHTYKYRFKMRFATPTEFLETQLTLLNMGKDQTDVVPYPSLTGDFHPYYELNESLDKHVVWSGFYSSGAFLKVAGRELESQLRAADILFTLSYNKVRKSWKLTDNYKRVLKARETLAFFQHYSLASGGSNSNILLDFYKRLLDSIKACTSVQKHSIEALIPRSTPLSVAATGGNHFEEELGYQPIDILSSTKTIVVFNSLAHGRYEVIKVLVNTPDILVTDMFGIIQTHQISPVWLKINDTDDSKVFVSKVSFELHLIAFLEGLSFSYFTIQHRNDSGDSIARIMCTACPESTHFKTKYKPLTKRRIRNHKFKVSFNTHSGFVESVEDETTGRVFRAQVKMSILTSSKETPNGYVFDPSYHLHSKYNGFLDDYHLRGINYVEGPVFTEIRVIYDHLLEHTVRLYHSQTPLGDGLFMETKLGYSPFPYKMGIDLVMDIRTDIDNMASHFMATDLNGFQMDMRGNLDSFGLPATYYPVGTAVYLQDDNVRVTLLVDRPHGISNFEKGSLKVMLDRKKKSSDGVVKGRYSSKYWLLFEDLSVPEREYPRISLPANYLSLSLRHPLNQFTTHQEVQLTSNTSSMSHATSLLTLSFPCNIHLMTLRTLTQEQSNTLPSKASIMVVQPLAYTCFTRKVYIKGCKINEVEYRFPKDVFTGMKSTFHQVTQIGGNASTKEITLNDVSYFPPALKMFKVTFT